MTKSRSRIKKSKLECPGPKLNSDYESGYYYVKRKSYKVSRNGKNYYVKSKCVKKRIPKKVCASCGYGDWGFLKRYKRKLKDKQKQLDELKDKSYSKKSNKVKDLENDIKELNEAIKSEIKKSKNKKIQYSFSKILNFNKK
jgi:hypothetical protein